MKIGIVGWGVEGQSVYKYFGPDNEYLIANEEPRGDFPPASDSLKVQFVDAPRTPGLTGNVADLSYLKDIETCDKIVYTPASYKNLRKLFGDDEAFWGKATSALRIFFENVKSQNIIGITGTKGKGTTSTLVANLLETEGKKVYLGGNIGNSVLDFVKDVNPDDWVVLELSNFQLIDFGYSPHIAVCLMITQEHQDWHADMEDYVNSKANIFKHQKSSDIAIYLAADKYSTEIACHSPGKKIPYFAKPGAFVTDDGRIAVGDENNVIIHKTEVKLLGEHNLQNICAAVTATYEALGGSMSLDKAKTVLSSFSGLEHRLELVRELEGVKYYDDSFATTPDAAIVAMKAFPQPKVLILGGSDKGLPYEKLAYEISRADVRHAIVIGQTAETIVSLLNEEGFSAITTGLGTMPEIVAAAHDKAKPGDAVLLSTGCASFGMFKDYKDRGNQFKQAVLELV